MESTSNIPHYHHNHHKHPFQDHQLVGSSSTTTTTNTALDTPGCVAASNSRTWIPNTILNDGGFGSAASASINSRNPRLQHDILTSFLNGCMTQDLRSFNWANSTRGNNFSNQQSCHDLAQLEMIKRELSDSYTNFNQMISSPSSSIDDMEVQMQPTSYRKNDLGDINDVPNAKFLLRTMSSGGQSNGLHQSCPEEFYCSISSSSALAAMPQRGGTSSQIYPTINVSNFSHTSLANSSSFDMNFQALDLLNSARSNGIFLQSMQDQICLSKNNLSYGYDHLKQSIQGPILEPRNITQFSSNATEAKRSDTNLEPKASQAASKRSRLESRASRPPFKVRKEKLGDRIAALQQLVAPFGKTDTASVLMEAIGYIKFLQNQVETLSIPYLKSSADETSKGTHEGQRKRDLSSRGLCLVPISCLSYVTDHGGSGGGGGGLWPPPSFDGGT